VGDRSERPFDTVAEPGSGPAPADPSLEGWAPDITDAETLAEVVDRAFDYRGDVTVVTADGALKTGYLFNRNRDDVTPFVEMFPSAGGPAETIAYASIRRIVFTGKDTAAGGSYAAWLKRKHAGGDADATHPGTTAASGG
jgi:hypothetical protein